MKSRSLCDFEKNFWISNNTFRDDRDNIVIKLTFLKPLKKDNFSKALKRTALFFPNLDMRVSLKNDGEPYLKNKSKDTNDIVEVESIEELHLVFDLNTGESIRFYFRNNNTIFIATHHFYFDKDSIKSFINTLHSLIKEPNHKFELSDHIQAKICVDDNIYWKEKLKNNHEPCSFFMPTEGCVGIGIIDKLLDNSTARGMEEFVAKNSTSATALVILTTAIILRKVLSEDNMVISTPVTLRNYTDDAKIQYGCNINVLPIPIHIDSSKTILELINETTFSLWTGIEHRNFSLNKLLNELGIDREIGLYNVMAEFVDEDKSINNFVTIPNKTARLGFSLSLIKRNNRYLIHIEFDKNKISDDYADAVANSFSLILNQTVNSPNNKASSLHMCSEAEEKRIINFGKGKSLACDTNIINKIIKIAKKDPRKNAIIHNNKSITYKDLLQLVANIEYNLRRKKIRKGTLVGINLERSIEYIAAQLALISIGAPFIPLDTALPQNRIDEVSDEANLGFVITNSPISRCGNVKNLDIQDLIKGQRRLPKSQHVDDKDLTYIIFTSGSTGKPKGVMINRLGFVNHQEIMIRYFNISKNSVVAQSAPVSFDISIWQLICPLMVGGTIDIIDKDILIDPEGMLDKISRDKITILEIVPSLISEYLDYELSHVAKNKILDSTKIISTGEGIAKKIAVKWNEQHPNNPLVNAYGPAEASDDTHFFEISSESILKYEDIPIGMPLDNIGTIILDCDDQICPQKIVGEICIYGISLSNGYINNTAKTAEVFKYISGIREKVYATGDYGRWIKDGILGYNGRRDNQVKIRGQRAELGEIEEKIRQILNVEKVAIVFHKFKNNNRLVCFIESTNMIDANLLKTRISNVLPCYMVPWRIKSISHLPTNNNGKLDRKKLDSLCEEITNPEERDTSHGRTNIIREICNIWAKLLGRKIDAESDFFELGGDSLLCLTASNELNKINIPVGPRDIIKERTPVGIAQILDNRKNNDQTIYRDLPRHSNIQKSYLRLSGNLKNSAEIQAGVYFNKKLNEENLKYLLRAIRQSLPFLKIDFLDNILSLPEIKDIHAEIEKNRGRLVLGKINMIAIPFYQDNNIKILFVAHHFYFDIYSWKILSNGLNSILDGENDFANIKNEDYIKKALSNNSYQKINFIVDNQAKYGKTKINFLDIPQQLNSLEYVKSQLLSSLHDAQIIKSSDLVILNEMSVRNDDSHTINSIGWGTYYESQKFDFTTSNFSEIKGTCVVKISDKSPLIIFNTISENQLDNKNLLILPTIINRTVPFIEIDITIGRELSTISMQSNLMITKNTLSKIYSRLQKNDDIPATSAQKSFLIGSEFGRNNLYKEQIVINISSYKKEDIKKQITIMTQKIKSLRMVFYEKNGEIFQKDSNITSPILTEEWCLESEINEIFLNERKKIPDLQKYPPIRYLIVDTIDNLYLCISYNHVLLDGDSVFFLLDFITSERNIKNRPLPLSSKKYSEEAAILYWKNEMQKIDKSDFTFPKKLHATGYKNKKVVLSKNATQSIYGLSKKFSTTPAIVVQSVFNCWALQYFGKKRIGYGFVYNIRNNLVDFNNLEPSVNTVPYISNKTVLTKNILDTIAKNKEREPFKDYSLQKILALSSNKFIPFDILLTITTRNIDSQKYDIIYTHEETEFPLAIDFDFSNGELFLTVATSNGIEPQNIIDSFVNSINGLLNDECYEIESKYTEEDTQIKSTNFSDIQSLKKLISDIVSTNINNIDSNQSFIANGGDSILALRLKNELNKLALDVTIGSILSSETLITLMTKIHKINLEQNNDSENDIVEKILENYSAGYEKNYHEQAAFRLSGNYNSSAMNAACAKIHKYVKSLRTFYYKNRKELSHDKSRVKYININKSCSNLSNAINMISGYDSNHPFNPEHGELLRIYTIMDKNKRHWYLFLCFSILVTDGWSFSELLKLLIKLYNTNKAKNLPKPAHEHVYSDFKQLEQDKTHLTIDSLKMTVDLNIINNYKDRTTTRITDSEFFEKYIKKVTKQYPFNKLLRYENNRDQIGPGNFNTIGCFARYTEIILNTNYDYGDNMLYVFENYPKIAEEELKNGHIQNFKESGNWRLPVLPPETNYGIFIEKNNKNYEITCYYEKEKNGNRKIARNILLALKREIKNEKR